MSNDPQNPKEPSADPVIIDVTPDKPGTDEKKDEKKAGTTKETSARTQEAKPTDKKGTTSVETPEKAPKRGLGILTGLVLLMAAFAAGAVFAPEIRQIIPGLEQTPSPAPQAAPTPTPDPAFASRLAALEQQVTALENTPPPATTAPAATPDLSGIEQRIDALAATVDTLNTDNGQQQADAAQTRALAQSVTGVQSDLSGLDSRLSNLENTLSGLETSVSSLQTAMAQRRAAEADATAPMTIVALGRLRQAVDQGVGFSPALESVEQLMVTRGSVPASAGTALETLESQADQGVATLATLRDEFDSIAGTIVTTDALAEDAGWWDRTVAAVSGAVTIRQTGEIEGTSTEARVARAEIALNAGNLDSAITEISAIDGRGAKTAAEWLTQAKARQAALAAVNTLEATLLTTATATP